MYSSGGVTLPLTTASPRPQLALIMISFLLLVTGLAVNITPLFSLLTIFWTTAER